MDKFSFKLPSCFLNIGGILNLTYWDGKTRPITKEYAEGYDRIFKKKKKKEKEIGGPSGPEPTRYGDWEKKGITTDF